MNKGTHFLGQPMYGQLISLLDKAQILRISQENGGERYVQHFDAWQHLVVMLYAVVKRFDSLREIVASMLPEARKLGHLGINAMLRRSTRSDTNLRRNECIFEAIYRELYATYKHVLSADSRRRGCPKWIERLQIIDSTTISLFSNLIFKGVGRHPKTGKKEGRDQSSRQYSCQRVCALRYPLHLGGKGGLLHAPPLQLPQRRYLGL